MYRIKYCKTNEDGTFYEVTPDIATIFRVFEIQGQTIKHIKDFYPLSEANKWITEQNQPQRSKSRKI